jgi:preprotein translocase subunit SecG
MAILITTVHIITCLLLILVILLQSGKGAEISASFGGSSQTVFGSSGGANFLQKFTTGAAVVFMMTSVFLTVIGGHRSNLMSNEPLPMPAASTLPLSAPSAAAPAAAETPIKK